jgi:hypothetical protein
VSFRLPREVADEFGPEAEGLDRVDGYNVKVLLASDRALRVAIEIARIAYDRALGN